METKVVSKIGDAHLGHSIGAQTKYLVASQPSSTSAKTDWKDRDADPSHALQPVICACAFNNDAVPTATKSIPLCICFFRDRRHHSALGTQLGGEQARLQKDGRRELDRTIRIFNHLAGRHVSVTCQLTNLPESKNWRNSNTYPNPRIGISPASSLELKSSRRRKTEPTWTLRRTRTGHGKP